MGGIFSTIGIIFLVLICFFIIWKLFGYYGNDQSSPNNIFEDDEIDD